MKAIGALSLISAAAVNAATTYDYVIVGGGTAGLAVAARLSEDPKVTVAVLEAGGTGFGNPNVTDLRNRYMPFGTQIDWVLPTVPQAAANGRVYTHAQGKVLGGSSAINGAVYIRPAKEEYAAFEKLGATGWSFTTLQKAGLKSEKLTMPTTKLGGVLPNPAYHGTNGPVSVTIQNNVSSFFNDVAVPTIKNLGHKWNPDNNGGSPNGATPVQVTIFPNSYNRSYSPNTYYLPNAGRANLHVFTDSPVSKILWKNSTATGNVLATGVEYLNGTEAQTLAAKNVIVSAGALHTPSIGVPVKVDLPGVGKNLQNQLGVNVQYRLKSENITAGAETQAPIIEVEPAQVILSAADLAKSEQLLSTKTGEISQEQFDIMKSLIKNKVAQTEMNWSLVKNADSTFNIQFYTTDLHTFSRGQVHASSSDPTAKPTLDPKYLSVEHDIWYLSRAVAYTRNITAAEPLASYIESEVTPGSNITSPDQLESWLKTNFRTMSHFVGTAAAVPKAKGGVVDPRNFKVYGTQNVRVVDASTIPLLPGIHTMSLVYAIAEYASERIKST
ncbi:flavin adenine dinucleotide binding [Rhizoctonia solani]|uniref:Flavin adenine dinucleotide binding n=1 Tax=Rhizoctonia solani TaxID=456999 RepID=A0A8H7I4G5_9AGAM|nr:flavin adenine dinucleotide binding [Rhizoctonia solani]